jgi:NodT family efflux transporter outer membrane factor (OMF) lipoprotein
MRVNKIINTSLYILCFVGLVSSCKIAEPPQMPRTTQLPSTFTGSTDTISMGDLIWEDFFNDPQLVQLIEVALNNNLDLLTAVQRIEVAKANFQIRKGALQPTLDVRFRARTGNVKENLLDNTINGDNVANQTQNYFLGLQSSWEIDVWGKLRSKKEAAYARYLATEKGKHLITTSLVAEVARMYYELLGLDNELQTLEKNIEFQEIALEMIQIQKVGGRATELAVQQFKAQLLRTKSLRFEKQQRIIEVENELNLLLGRYPQPIERGESILKQRLPEVVRAGIPSDMLLRRPDIQQAELRLAAAEADVEAARAEFLPSFEITPYAGFNTASLPSLMNMPEALTLGMIGGITAPLLNQNRIRAGYDQSVARNLEEFYTYQQKVLTGYQEVVSCLNRVDNFTKVFELREQEVEVLTNSISTSNDLFAAGYATYLEVITAQGRALEAELSMTNTRKEIFVSLIDLYRALGGGWK